MEKKIIIGLVMIILLGATMQLFAKESAGSINSFDPASDISFKLYPNPASSQVTFSLLDHAEIINQLTIYNAVGEVVYSIKINQSNAGDAIEIDVSSFQKGMYIIQISGPNVLLTRKLVIRK